MSVWDFARQAGSDNLQIADHASILGEALLRFERGEMLTYLPGAGLFFHNGKLNIVVLANAEWAELSPSAVVPLSESRSARDTVITALRGSADWTSRIWVFAVTPPERQITAGSTITGPHVGTIGTQAVWNNGSGFFTAGHVAPTVGTQVYENAVQIGVVAWSNNPAGHGTVVEPDVAVVNMLPSVPFSNPIANITTAGPADTVTVSSTRSSGQIMGHLTYVYMPSQHGTCGDSYFTTLPITRPGDSGGPVLKGADVIGHVVGASPGITSYIQDITYQIREASNPLRNGLMGLRI